MRRHTCLLIGLLSISVLVLHPGCTQHNDLGTGPTYDRSLSITMPLGVAVANGYSVTRVHVGIERAEFSDEMDLDIRGDMASGVFVHLQAGVYTVLVDCYEGDARIAAGVDEGEVVAGETTTVHINLVFLVGNLEIVVEWPDPDANMPTEALVAHYQFNGNALDVGGYVNDGIVHGATPTKDRFGGSDGAYDFDGTDDSIEIALSPELTMTTNSWTVSAWIKTNQRPDRATTIISNYGGSNVGAFWGMLIGEDGRTCVGGRDTYGRVHYPGAQTEEAVNDGAWHHLVGIRDTAQDQFLVLVDGTVSNTCADPTGGDLNSGRGIWIARHLEWMFEGAIDDVRIYRRALSEDDVQTLFHEGGWTGH